MIDGSGATYVIHRDGANLSVTQATINVISAAASIAAGFGGKAGVAFSGAGAFAQNVILSKTNTSIRNSNIISADDVLLSSTSTQVCYCCAFSRYANGGQAKGIYRYLGFQDFLSDQSSVPGGSVTTGTVVKDLDDGAFYEFIGTAGEGAAITDLSVIDFANDTDGSFIHRRCGG